MGTLRRRARLPHGVLLHSILPLILLALSPLTASAADAVRANRSTAVAARTLTLHLTVTSRAINHSGRTINEQGVLSGTLSGTMSEHYVGITNTEGTATMTWYLSGGGTLKLTAKTSGRVQGATGYFSGGGTIVGGTGRWAHAHGRNLRFSGTIDRQNLRATWSITGTLEV